MIFQVLNLNTEIEEIQAHTVNAYIVIDEIKSGTEITTAQVQRVELNMDINVDTSTLYTTIPAGLMAKVDLNPGTVMTTDLTYENEPLTSDVRTVEYNVITLPSQLTTGEYIDIRLRTPDGRSLIVISHKEVTIPQLAGVDSTNCIWLDLTEEEILMMSCAIVETYQMNGAMLYTTKYVEAGIQEAATVTYVPNDEVRALIERDPNIVQEAKNALLTTLNSNSSLVRPGIESSVNNEDAADNVVEKTEDEITSLQQEREAYIDSLGG